MAAIESSVYDSQVDSSLFQLNGATSRFGLVDLCRKPIARGEYLQ